MITGSSRGIGFALARGLGAAGARVVVNGRNEEAVEKATAALRQANIRAAGCVFDVTDAAAVERAVAGLEEGGAIDVLVNNAGAQRRAPLESMTEGDWEAVIRLNLTAAFLVAQSVGRRMIPRRRGKIVNVCSLMSEVARPTTGNYAAAKGGLKMLTRSLAVEWARHNIQVNGIAPGYFRTEMTRSLYEDPQVDAWVRARTPAGRWGDPEELAGAAVFLSSPASDFVSGQVLYVDGGVLASL